MIPRSTAYSNFIIIGRGEGPMFATRYSRRNVLSLFASATGLAAAGTLPLFGAVAAESDDEALMKHFEYLSTNGNSNCSGAFTASIATLPPMTRLQGSCCAPMDAHRYIEQIKALRAYKHIAEIPDDPYDIPAGLARMLMGHYEVELTAPQQAAYDHAMENSDERGPCCCACWRWYVYGGLAKQLIRERGFSGEQLTVVWNLSSGCGGTEHHR
jgi:hypothetical protein